MSTLSVADKSWLKSMGIEVNAWDTEIILTTKGMELLLNYLYLAPKSKLSPEINLGLLKRLSKYIPEPGKPWGLRYQAIPFEGYSYPERKCYGFAFYLKSDPPKIVVFLEPSWSGEIKDQIKMVGITKPFRIGSVMELFVRFTPEQVKGLLEGRILAEDNLCQK